MSTTDDAPDVEQDDTPDPATWDPQAWLAGATSTVRTIRVYPHGDMVARLQEIDEKLRIARSISDEDRALGDSTPEVLWEQRDDLAREFNSSSALFKVEGRSSHRREGIDKRLEKAAKKVGDAAPDEDEKALHYVADAVVAPDGITVEWLRTFREKSEAQFNAIYREYVAACSAPPAVTVPSSGAGSRGQRQPRSS